MAEDSRAAHDGASAPEHIGVIVIHGNGEAEPGWINPYVIDRLQDRLRKKPHANRLEFDAHSRVYSLPDEGGSGDDPRFEAYVRRGQMATGPKVTFAELNWADLSRVGNEPIFQLFAALRLFYEAPNVLTKSFLEGGGNWFHILLRGLVAVAIWMVRWLVAGLNGMLFITLAVALLIQTLWQPATKILDGTLGMKLPDVSQGAGLAWLLMAILLGLGVLCGALAMRGERKGYGLTDVWIATGLFCALGLGALLVMQVLSPAEFHKITDYLKPLSSANFLISFTWDVIAAIAVAMFLALSLKRAVLPAAPGSPPLPRIGAALALAIIQAQVWKICVPAAAALTINAMGWNTVLEDAYRAMTNVGVLNSFLMALDLVLVYALMRVGGWVRPLYRSDRGRKAAGLPEDEKGIRRSQDLARVADLVPRVIISWSLVVLLGLGPIANLYQHYLNRLGGEIGRPLFQYICGNLQLDACIADSNWLQLVILLVGLVMLVFLALGRLQALFMGVLHFGRDIVDHQYRPDGMVVQQVRRHAVRKRGAVSSEGYPRRERISRRLDKLMTEVVRRERFDRIILLTHSQGSVIAHDGLVAGAQATQAVLGEVPELHVVTLGSPLSHLYQFYFKDYERAGREADWVPANLCSWTNMWRIDDPIADEVHIGPGDLVSNVPLEPGGHDDYWKEPQVCDLLLQLLELPRLRAKVQ